MPLNDEMIYKPKITAFCCNWCSYAGADLAGTSRLKYPAEIKIIRVPCSCRVNPLFILRAFLKGADGVIICGCHPGDCHYMTGNYHAGSRMAVLFELLSFIGIEKERTRLEWVSAAEGVKFAEVMEDFAAKVARLGKFKLRAEKKKDKPRFVCRGTDISIDTKYGREHTKKLLCRAKTLMEDGSVNRVLAYKEGEFSTDYTPAVFNSVQELEEGFVLNEKCLPLLSKYLIKESRREGKILVFLRASDTYALNRLIEEHRVKRENIYVIGVEAARKHDSGREYALYDELILEASGGNSAKTFEGAADEVSEFEKLSREERHAFWSDEFSKCIRCNACRNACPICSCVQCIFDNPNSGFENKALTEEAEGNMYHVIRAFHVSGRCVSCGECTRVCPQHIPLYLLNQKAESELKRGSYV